MHTPPKNTQNNNNNNNDEKQCLKMGRGHWNRSSVNADYCHTKSAMFQLWEFPEVGFFLWTHFGIPLWFPGQPGWVCPQRRPLQLPHLLSFSRPSPSPLLPPPPHHQGLAHRSSYAGHLYPQAVASKFTVRSRWQKQCLFFSHALPSNLFRRTA